MPAVITAKTVIVSATRATAVRHSTLSRNRIADISVPAWPIPIQNTKFVMYVPQPTAEFSPVTPMPLKVCNPKHSPNQPMPSASTASSAR